jgi:hypothetical protein
MHEVRDEVRSVLTSDFILVSVSRNDGGLDVAIPVEHVMQHVA